MLKTLLVGLFLLLCTLPGVAQAVQEQSVVDSLQVSPDGKLLAVSFLKTQPDVDDSTQAVKPGELQVWEISSGRLKWSVPLRVLVYQFPQILFAPDSAALLTTNVVITTVVTQNAPNFSPYENSATIAVPIQQAQSVLWDAATGEQRSVLEHGHGDRIPSLAFSPDGNELVGGVYVNWGRRSEAEPKDVHVWDPRTGKLLRRTLLGESTPQYMAFSKDGRSLQTLSPEPQKNGPPPIMRWESWSWPEGMRQQTHRLPEPGGRLFVPLTQGQDMVRLRPERGVLGNKAHLWDIESRSVQELILPRGLIKEIDNFSLLPDGKTLVGYVMGRMSIDGKEGVILYQDYLCFWNEETGQLSRTLKVGELQKSYSHRNRHVAYTPDGQQFVISKPTGKIELRNLEDGALIRVFE